MNRSPYNKLADAVYDRVSDRDAPFKLSEVTDEIVRELSTEEAGRDLIHAFAQSLAERVDDQRARRAESNQMDLLTGDVVALDAVWRLGNGQRIRAREAKRDQVVAWLAVRGQNARRVAEAYDHDVRQVAELLTWMSDDQMTVADAVAARKAAQPPQAS